MIGVEPSHLGIGNVPDVEENLSAIHSQVVAVDEFCPPQKRKKKIVIFMVSPAATLDLLHPREAVLEQIDGSLNKYNIEPLEADKGSGERQERMGCNEIPQAEAGLSLDPS